MVCHASGTSMQVVTFLLTPGQESLCTWTPSNPARTAVQNYYNTIFGVVCSFSKIVKINLLFDQTLVYFYVLSVPIVLTSPVVPDDVSDEEYSVTYASVPIVLTSLVVAD